MIIDVRNNTNIKQEEKFKIVEPFDMLHLVYKYTTFKKERCIMRREEETTSSKTGRCLGKLTADGAEEVNSQWF